MREIKVAHHPTLHFTDDPNKQAGPMLNPAPGFSITVEYNGKKIPGFLTDSITPWWMAEPICQFLGYSDTHQGIQFVSANNLKKCSGLTPNMPWVWVVKHDGIFELLRHAGEDAPEDFREWVYDVYPRVLDQVPDSLLDTMRKRHFEEEYTEEHARAWEMVTGHRY